MSVALSSIKKILVINIFGIGDVLFTTPVLSNLHDSLPDAKISYLCNARTQPVLKAQPLIDKVFVYERDHFHRLWRTSPWRYWEALAQLMAALKVERFDLVLDFSLNSLMHFLTLTAGIPLRAGFNFKNRSPFLTHPLPLLGYEGRHVVEYYLDLLRQLGFSERIKHLILPIPDENKDWASERLAAGGIKKEDLLMALVPGGGGSWGTQAAFKRWPVEDYLSLADKMIEKFKAKIILLGDLSEKDLCARLKDHLKEKAVDFSGQTEILQMAALLSFSHLAVVNDGGPLHIAVAVGTKTVSIFGPVDERVYGPYPLSDHRVVHSDVVCRPCYRRFRLAACAHHLCLKIPVAEVLRKVEELL